MHVHIEDQCLKKNNCNNDIFTDIFNLSQKPDKR